MKRFLCLSLALLCLATLAACELKEPPSSLEPEPTVGLGDQARLFKITEHIPPTPPPEEPEQAWELNQAKADIAQNVTPFADCILDDAAGENYVYSPLSTWLACRFLSQGLNGEAREQLLDVLEPQDLEQPELEADALRDIADRMRDGGLRLQNYLFVNNEYDVQDDFARSAEDFRADIYKVLLDGDIESSKLLNEVIARDSGGLIQDYYTAPIDPGTTAILMNTLALNAEWETPFDPADTTEQPFHLADGTDVDVPMMHLHEAEDFKYAEDDNGAYLQLKYTSGDYLVLALPKEGVSPEAALAGWRATRYELEYVMPKVNLALPKVAIQSDWGLKDKLTELGLGYLFEGGPGMDGILEDRDFRLSEVTQQAKIEIFEEGTKASAVTEIPMGMGGFVIPDEPLDLIFDRPFAFAVYSGDGDLELFRGAVYDPLAD